MSHRGQSITPKVLSLNLLESRAEAAPAGCFQFMNFCTGIAGPPLRVTEKRFHPYFCADRPSSVPRTGNEVSMDSLEKSLEWLFSEEPRSGASWSYSVWSLKRRWSELQGFCLRYTITMYIKEADAGIEMG